MKPIIITLLYLTFGGEIRMESFEINTTCSSWFHTNVAQIENQKKTLFSGRTYHVYKKKRVIGYICADNPPQ